MPLSEIGYQFLDDYSDRLFGFSDYTYPGRELSIRCWSEIGIPESLF